MRADPRHPGRAPSRQRGLTLIELIMFIIIISVGIAGILSVMNVTVRASADPMLTKQAVSMAEAILEEILSKDYSNPAGGYTETDTNTCANRQLYDDIADYTCFDGAPATAVIDGTDTLGAASIAALANYSARVAVAAPAALDGVTMRQVTVTVTNPAGAAISLSAFKANY